MKNHDGFRKNNEVKTFAKKIPYGTISKLMQTWLIKCAP